MSKQLLLDNMYINNYPLVSSESRRKSLMVCHFWLPKIKTMESDLANVRIFFQGNTVESLRTQLCRNQHDLHRLVQVGPGLPSALLPHELNLSFPCSCHYTNLRLGSTSLSSQSLLSHLYSNQTGPGTVPYKAHPSPGATVG